MSTLSQTDLTHILWIKLKSVTVEINQERVDSWQALCPFEIKHPSDAPSLASLLKYQNEIYDDREFQFLII